MTVAGGLEYITAEFNYKVYYIFEDDVADLVANPLSQLQLIYTIQSSELDFSNMSNVAPQYLDLKLTKQIDITS